MIDSADPKFWRSLIASGVASVFNAAILHPTFTIKSRLQSNEPVPRTLRGLYAGVTVGTLAKLPDQLARIVVSNWFRAKVYKANQLEPYQQITVSFWGGFVASGLFLGPAELIIRRQQYLKMSSPLLAVRTLYRTQPISRFMLGSTMSAFSGGAYTAAYYALMPLFERHLVQEYGVPSYMATVIAGLTSGASMALLTHPGDTIKAVQHRSGGEEFVGIVKAAKTVMKESGLKGFMSGGAARVTRLAFGTVIMGKAIPWCEKVYDSCLTE